MATSSSPTRPPRPTLRQVATAAGVAPATVSMILNDHPACYASQETRQRVHQAAQDLNYRPNMVARTLLAGRSHTLAMIVTTLEAELTMAKCQAFEACARQQGYFTFIAYNPGDAAQEDRLLQAVVDRGVDGLVVYPTFGGNHTELRRLRQMGFPLVTVNAAERLDFSVHDVSLDFYRGGQCQAQHLVDLGRRRVALIYQSFASGRELRDRVDGATHTLQAHQAGPCLMLELQQRGCPAHEAGAAGYEQIFRFLQQHAHALDGIIATNDSVAGAVISAAINQGIRIPDDLAVVGFDGIASARTLPVPLTTAAQPISRIGQTVFALLERQIAGQGTTTEVEHVKLLPEVLVRASTVTPAPRPSPPLARV